MNLTYIHLWTLVSYTSMSMWTILSLNRHKEKNQLDSNRIRAVLLIFLASPFMYPIMLFANIYDLIESFKNN